MIRISFVGAAPVAGAALLCGAAGALAHAFLDHADPAVGSTVHGSPPELSLWFTQELEPAFSTVEVVDQSGQEVDKRDKSVDPTDRTLLRVSLPTLPPGTYKVIWHVLSVDTHTTHGDFKFTVAP